MLLQVREGHLAIHPYRSSVWPSTRTDLPFGHPPVQICHWIEIATRTSKALLSSLILQIQPEGPQPDRRRAVQRAVHRVRHAQERQRPRRDDAGGREPPRPSVRSRLAAVQDGHRGNDGVDGRECGSGWRGDFWSIAILGIGIVCPQSSSIFVALSYISGAAFDILE